MKRIGGLLIVVVILLIGALITYNHINKEEQVKTKEKKETKVVTKEKRRRKMKWMVYHLIIMRQ